MPLMYAAAPFVDGADTADAPGTSATVVIESSARGQSRAAPLARHAFAEQPSQRQ